MDKKYKHDVLLFNTLYSLASKQDSEAVELLLRYLKDKDRRGFAAEALGRLKEKRAVGIIVEILKDSLIFNPELITCKDVCDSITLSSYVYMIRAIKLIGEAGHGVLKMLEDYSTKVKDIEIRREAKEALDGLCPDPNCKVHLNYDLNLEKKLLNDTVENRTEKELKPGGKISTQKGKYIMVSSPEKSSPEKSSTEKSSPEKSSPEKSSPEKEFLLKSCKKRNQYSLKHRRSTAIYKYMNRF